MCAIDDRLKSLEAQTYLHFVDFLDMCACMLHASLSLVCVMLISCFFLKRADAHCSASAGV